MTPLLLACALLSMSVAFGQSAQAKENAIQIGREGRVDSSGLTIAWPSPSARSNLSAVTLKIPLAYLARNPIAMYPPEQEIRAVYLAIGWPSGEPLREYQSGKLLEDAKFHTRTLIRINRNDSGGNDLRQSVRHRHSLNSSVDNSQKDLRYTIDGGIGGLERYSLRRCYSTTASWSEEGEIWWRKFLREKPADDTSAAGCRMDRTDFKLMSDSSVKSHDRGVLIECSMRCAARFQAGGRMVEVPIAREELPQWEQKVDMIRRLVNSFVAG